MALGAFGVVIALGPHGENLSGYRGLATRAPGMAAVMFLFLLSLTGIPPTAGFTAKFAVILSAVRAGYTGLAVLAVLCSVVFAFVLAGGFVAANIILASTLGPKKPSAVKLEPFECGQVPFALPIGHLSVKFYLTAILFILFDVELVFLYPWAVVYRTLGGSG